MIEDLLNDSLLRNALIAGLLAAFVCGIIGSYVVVRRMVFISTGISHASFGGIGLAHLVGMTPIFGALLFALISASVIAMSSKRTKAPDDTVIGTMMVMGMALGIVFVHLSPGRTPDLTSYLFGNILLVSSSKLILLAILGIIITATVLLLYKEFLALSFDEEFGTVVGLPTQSLHLVLLFLIALAVVMLVKVVGIILATAFLTIPAATARQFTHSLWKIMLLSITLGIIYTVIGLFLSYYVDIPTGAVIVLVAGASYLLCLAGLRLIATNRNCLP